MYARIWLHVTSACLGAPRHGEADQPLEAISWASPVWWSRLDGDYWPPFSLAPKGLTSTAHTLTYYTVMEGALVMLMITIATGSHLFSKKSVNGRGTSLH